jgi:hypothetical protein
VAISRRPKPSCGRRPTKRAGPISSCDPSTGGEASARGWEAEIVSRTRYSLPVEANAVTRRIIGYIAANVAEDTR